MFVVIVSLLNKIHMAISGTYYLNAPSLASATAVYDDALLTTLSADGYYAEGVIVRQQVSGVLLPQQLCPAYVGFSSSVSAMSSDDVCMLGETEMYYSLTGIVNLGDTIYDDTCGITTLEEGYYRASGSIAGGNDWFQLNASGVVINIGVCTPPVSYDYYLADKYDCGSCTLDTANVVVGLPTGTIPDYGKFYVPMTFDGFTYNLLISTTPGPSTNLSTSNFTTCGAACV